MDEFGGDGERGKDASSKIPHVIFKELPHKWKVQHCGENYHWIETMW